LFTLLGVIPPLGRFLGTIPLTIGNAVLFVAYLQLFGTALNSLKGTLFNSETILRLAGPVLVGVSIMNIPPALFGSIPVLLQPFITNGLIMGVIISILLEKFINWNKLMNKLEVGQ
jgi:xanthine/uracil permease